MNTEKFLELFQAEKLTVINVGVRTFGEALEKQDVNVVQVDWRPPAGGDKEMEDILDAFGF